VALEITSAVDPSVVSQLKAAFGQQWSCPRLANNWMIAIQHTRGEPPASIRKVMAGMVPILELFERRGQTSVEVRSSPRHRLPAPGATEEMPEAMIRMFEQVVAQLEAASLAGESPVLLLHDCPLETEQWKSRQNVNEIAVQM
jgi:hypothetical protein